MIDAMPDKEEITNKNAIAAPNVTALLSDVRRLIEDARERTAVAVNRELTLLYWNIGRRIRQDVLGGERAEYGLQILQTLSAKLMADGQGYSANTLSRMMSFAGKFPNDQIVGTLSRQLSNQ